LCTTFFSFTFFSLAKSLLDTNDITKPTFSTSTSRAMMGSSVPAMGAPSSPEPSVVPDMHGDDMSSMFEDPSLALGDDIMRMFDDIPAGEISSSCGYSYSPSLLLPSPVVNMFTKVKAEEPVADAPSPPPAPSADDMRVLEVATVDASLYMDFPRTILRGDKEVYKKHRSMVFKTKTLTKLQKERLALLRRKELSCVYADKARQRKASTHRRAQAKADATELRFSAVFAELEALKAKVASCPTCSCHAAKCCAAK